jgi:hypothetical protein
MTKRFLFHFSLIALAALEVYRMYLLSPIPGSQESEMVHISYPLWHYRWIARSVLLLLAFYSLRSVLERRKWIPAITIVLCGFLTYAANFEMSADKMFHEAETLMFTDAAASELNDDALVITVSVGNESHAYPIRYLEYHHRVADVVNGESVWVTYCNVCRSALVFKPIVAGNTTTFRLIGMDQFNAIFEDRETKSWWAQATGTCIAGERKGDQLAIFPARQLTLGEWKSLFPKGKVMLPDPAYVPEYGDGSFEKGTIKSTLVGSDTSSWGEKSWVIGIVYQDVARAYDWRHLQREKLIFDTIHGDTLIISAHPDGMNFQVAKATWPNGHGSSCEPERASTVPIPARQMFWHTWRTFYPTTSRFPEP